MDRLVGRVALVTGAGSGLGAAIAQRLAAEGAGVGCADIDEPAAQTTATAIADAGGRSLAVHLDVTDSQQQATAAAAVNEELGGIDICVANAGIPGVGSAHEVDEATWARVLAVNLTGVWLTAKAALPAMLGQASGSIIMTASIGGVLGVPRLAPYAASKGAVIALMRQMAIDYAPHGIRVNAVAPGTVMTPLVAASAQLRGEDGGVSADERARQHPLGRLGSPGDIAAAVAYLASDDAAWVTGTVLAVAGGRSAKA